MSLLFASRLDLIQNIMLILVASRELWQDPDCRNLLLSRQTQIQLRDVNSDAEPQHDHTRIRNTAKFLSLKVIFSFALPRWLVWQQMVTKTKLVQLPPEHAKRKASKRALRADKQVYRFPQVAQNSKARHLGLSHHRCLKRQSSSWVHLNKLFQ